MFGQTLHGRSQLPAAGRVCMETHRVVRRVRRGKNANDQCSDPRILRHWFYCGFYCSSTYPPAGPMAFRSLTSLFAALLVAGLLVGETSVLFERPWSARVGEHTGLGVPVAGDTVDTTATEPDSADGHAYPAGVILYARDDGVPIRDRPSAKAGTLAVVRATDPLVSLGRAEAGFLWVRFPGGQGWVHARFVTRE